MNTEQWEPDGENDSACLVGRLEDDVEGKQMKTEKRSEPGDNLSGFMLVSGFSRKIDQREHTGGRSDQRNNPGKRLDLEDTRWKNARVPGSGSGFVPVSARALGQSRETHTLGGAGEGPARA